MTLLSFNLKKATAENVRHHHNRNARADHIHVHKDCINVWWGADRDPTTYHPTDFCLLHLAPSTKNVVLRPYYGSITGQVWACEPAAYISSPDWAGPEFTIEIEVPE